MPALRGPDGKIVYAPDEEVSSYLAGGYTPIGEAAAGAAQSQIERPDSGILGSVGALASSALSGATLGASDWLLKGGLTQGQFEQLAEDRRQNPILSGLGMTAGAIAPMVLSGGAATPAGALGRLSASALEGADAVGGASGAARSLAIAGTEGAIQNAGVYLSDVALGDRDLTAEGMTGALGTGFAFGGGGLIAAHGIVGGAMAARRMFARYAEGGEAAARSAEIAWRDGGGAQIESFEQAAKIARGKLEEAQIARQQADVARRQAAADLAEARVAPIDAPGAPGAASGAPPATPDAAGITQADRDVAAMLGRKPEDIAGARLNRERARLTNLTPDAEAALNQRIADVTGAPPGPTARAPGEEGFRRVYSSGVGAEAAPPAPGFATMIRDLEAIPGVRRVPLSDADRAAIPGAYATEAEADLAGKLDAYQVARRDFDEIHARVDPDLDAAMRELAPSSVQRPAVPVGEFGAPGQRGIKSPAEIERAARDAALPDVGLASGTPSQLEATRAGKVASGVTPEPTESPLKRGLPERARSGGKHKAIKERPVGQPTTAEPAVAPATPQSAGPQPIVPGKKISELARPGETPEDFVLRRMREQGERAFERTDAPEVWLGSLGIDWTVPENKAVALRMLRDGRAELSRADLVDMFDPKMIEASSVGDEFGDFHFIHDTTPRRAAADAAVPAPARGVPEYADLKAQLDRAGSDYVEATLPAREIADRGYYEPPGGGVDKVRMEKAAQAIREGQREPIILGVSKEGKIVVDNGRHRLAAAIEQGAPIKVKWTTMSEPSEDMVLRGAARASAREPETELEALLRGTKRRIDRGESLAEMAGVPVAGRRAEAAPAIERPRMPASANADVSLEGLLTGTKAQLDAGKALRDITPGDHPLSIKQLEIAHDDALERAATATEPEAKRAAEREVRAIEEQMTKAGARPGAVEDVAALAPVVHRLEKAAADLTEALGEAAPAAAREHAQAFRAAESKADEATMARMARAADDHAAAAEAVQAEDFLGPGVKDRRIEVAKARRAEAEAAHARARANEAQAKFASDAAERDLARARPAEAPATGKAPISAHGSRVVDAAHAVGYAAELGSDLGIPGIPRPHDIPVIGPILSAYLKYRALKAAAGRFTGRIPASANARAAELAARTRDGIARAVDRSLGLVEASAKSMPRAISMGAAVATSALSKRIVDDGQPDAPDGASVQRLAAARIREVAAVAANPRLLLDKVSFETRGITDPQLITAVENHLTAMFAHLNEVAPKGPPPNPYTKQEWVPSAADAVEFGKRLAVANDPQVAFKLLEAGKLTPGPAETMRAVYSRLFAEAQKRVTERANDLRNPVPYRQLMQAALLFGVPLHSSLDPENASVIRNAYATATGGAPAPQAPGAPPVPGIAAPINISGSYKTSFERSLGGR